MILGRFLLLANTENNFYEEREKTVSFCYIFICWNLETRTGIMNGVLNLVFKINRSFTYSIYLFHALSQVSRMPSGNAISSQRMINGVALEMAKGDGHAKKNSHPPFVLTKRHLWRRDRKFSLLPRQLFYSQADRVRRHLKRFRYPRELGYSIIRQQ